MHMYVCVLSQYIQNTPEVNNISRCPTRNGVRRQSQLAVQTVGGGGVGASEQSPKPQHKRQRTTAKAKHNHVANKT